MYQSLFDFSNYYLKDAPAICSYIYPIHGSKDVAVDDTITVKFTGPVSREEIEQKVTVAEKSTGIN